MHIEDEAAKRLDPATLCRFVKDEPTCRKRQISVAKSALNHSLAHDPHVYVCFLITLRSDLHSALCSLEEELVKRQPNNTEEGVTYSLRTSPLGIAFHRNRKDKARQRMPIPSHVGWKAKCGH